MYMRDWKERLDMILKMNERKLLEDAGKISHELAKQKAESEYAKYKDIERQQIHLESIKELDMVGMLMSNQNLCHLFGLIAKGSECLHVGADVLSCEDH